MAAEIWSGSPAEKKGKGQREWDGVQGEQVELTSPLPPHFSFNFFLPRETGIIQY